MIHRQSLNLLLSPLVILGLVACNGCDPTKRADKELLKLLASPGEYTPEKVAELCAILGHAGEIEVAKALANSTDAKSYQVLACALLMHDIDKFLPLAIETGARIGKGYSAVVEFVPRYLTPSSRVIIQEIIAEARGPSLCISVRFLALVCDDEESLRLLSRLARLPDLSVQEEVQILPTLGEAAYLNDDGTIVAVFHPYIRPKKYSPALLGLIRVPGAAASELLEEAFANPKLGISPEFASELRARRRELFSSRDREAVAWRVQHGKTDE